MVLEDMFQVTHKMTQAGQPLMNVYHAMRTSEIENSQTISDSFVATIVGPLRLLQVNTIDNIEVVVFNLGLSTDFHTQSLAGNPGTRIIAASPSFVGAAVRFASRDRDIRSGQKRFAGMSETDYEDGILNVGAVTLIEDVADVLVGDWLTTPDPHAAANYVIIKRVCETVDPVTGKCLEYRLPETDLELKFYVPTTYVVNPDISSQVSRKVF